MEVKTIEPQLALRKVYGKAIPKVELNGWEIGALYDVFVTKMKRPDSRVCIYKGQKHWNEESGYKVYSDIESMSIDFDLVRGSLTDNGLFIPDDKQHEPSRSN